MRDGRDMAFHWLQSPVKRYWPHLFPKTMAHLPKRLQAENQLVPSAGSYEGRAYLYDVPKLNTVTKYRKMVSGGCKHAAAMNRNSFFQGGRNFSRAVLTAGMHLAAIRRRTFALQSYGPSPTSK